MGGANSVLCSVQTTLDPGVYEQLFYQVITVCSVVRRRVFASHGDVLPW